MQSKHKGFFLLILIALFFSIPMAQGVEPTGHFTTLDGAIYYVANSKAKVVGIDPMAHEIIIHATVDGAQASLEKGCFRDAVSAETIVIEDGLAPIHYLCFEGLEKLKTVDIYCDVDIYGDIIDSAKLLDCPNVTSLSFYDQNKSADVATTTHIEIRDCPKFATLVIEGQYYKCYLDIRDCDATVILPASMEFLVWMSPTEIKEVIIDPQNPFLKVIDGVVSNAEYGILSFYSRHKEDLHYDIPEGTVDATITSPYLKSITLPESLEYIELDCTALETIICSEKNPYMKAVDSVLYSKDGTYLLAYPRANQATEFIIPEGVDSITIESDYLEHLSITEGIEELDHCRIDAKNLQTLTLPSTLENFPISYRSHVPNLQAVYIAHENPYMKSIDGCVYSANGEELHYVPSGKKSLIIAEGTKFFNPLDNCKNYWYFGGENVQSISFPASMSFDNENNENKSFSFFCQRNYYMDHPMHSPKTYYVAENHPSVIAIDGFLFSKDGKTLIAAPLIEAPLNPRNSE